MVCRRLHVSEMSGRSWRLTTAPAAASTRCHSSHCLALVGQPTHGLPASSVTACRLTARARAALPHLLHPPARRRRYNKSEGGDGRSLQSPVPPCHFYVDHKYRILYVRSTKTASTSISSTLGMKENPKTCK